ncbi:hypothetical protein RE428_10270 [Marinobacter nanhaiticus D15-8W]|nr:hypothetical protein RE428_10270 [Marinobacter nanhaiticus D15-8W]
MSLGVSSIVVTPLFAMLVCVSFVADALASVQAVGLLVLVRASGDASEAEASATLFVLPIVSELSGSGVL